MANLKGKLSARGTISGGLSARASLSGKLTVSAGGGAPPYTGEYEFTPSEEAQTAATRNKRMTDDITINPIPSNYGRIAWDGVTLSVY